MACKPGSVHPALARMGWMTIHLGRLLPDASRDTPGRRHTSPLEARSSWPSFSILHPVGFTVPSLSPGTRCALTAPFHPYLNYIQAVYSLLHWPWTYVPQALPGTLPCGARTFLTFASAIVWPSQPAILPEQHYFC